MSHRPPSTLGSLAYCLRHYPNSSWGISHRASSNHQTKERSGWLLLHFLLRRIDDGNGILYPSLVPSH
jgi:hypothetical protein